MDGVATAHRTGLTDTGWRSPRNLAGLSGLGMLAAILANGPLASIRGVPQYWEPDAATRVGELLGDQASFVPTLAFFFLSTLIFVFGIPFVAGLRRVVREHDPDGLGADVVLLGAALFFGAGLLSEVLSTGFAIVVNSAPDYVLDANAALGVQALQFAALVQGQVGLGLVVIAASLAIARGDRAPGWLVVLGLIAGGLDLVRPLAAANPPLAIGLFLPTFVWIAAISGWLLRTPAAAQR
ncbi:MAG: hypothetical protein ACRDG7_09640 [Candidatus Limnocylindria bacterium]